MKRILFVILVNIAVFCTLVVTIEIFGQAAYYLRYGKFVFQSGNNDSHGYYGRTFEMHPFLGARLKKNVRVKHAKDGKTITTTNEHTRWTGAPEDDRDLIRVVVLGGSTTFGTNVTDSDSWPAILQTMLGDKFSVTNYGIPCFSTAEAIIQLALIVPEKKPDFVVLYQGWNDLFQYHGINSPDYYSMSIYDCLGIPLNKTTTLEKLNEVSAIVRLSTRVQKKLFRDSATRPCVPFETPDPFVDRIYVRNLQTLKLLSEHIAPYTLFVPQVLNYHEFITNKKKDSCSWYAAGNVKVKAVPRLLDRLNSMMRTVCPKGDPKCIFVDSVLKVKWEPDDFMDFGHFSRKGGEKFAAIISHIIRSSVKKTAIEPAK